MHIYIHSNLICSFFNQCNIIFCQKIYLKAMQNKHQKLVTVTINNNLIQMIRCSIAIPHRRKKE